MSERDGYGHGGTFDAPGGTRVAVAADPQGAVFALLEAGELCGAQVVNEPGARR
jgi:hypothetical protein